LIAGQLYKLGLDSILRRCVLDHERQDILWECHNGVAGGHVGGKATAQKVLQAGLWWETLFKDAKVYARSCDVCQRVGKPSRRDELPLQPVRALQAFEKWAVDFIGPINPTTKHSKARYIITATDYLTRWAEATVVQDCSTDTAARFIFENIITRFGCPRSLTSDQGAHFISSTIENLTTEFLIQHHKSNPYHPQANGTVEAFNKILERGLTKVCCTNREDWDDRVPTVLWAYRTTTKKLHRYTPFQLVYGKEAVVPAEFITPSLYIAQITHMSEEESVAQRLMELQELEETRFLADFHQSVEKERKKSWHDRHIKTKVFAQGDKVLLYDSRYQKHPGKLCMHWLGPFIVAEIRPSGAVRLAQLDGMLQPGWVNGARLKPYMSQN
jgi:transposase InsO family protein